jgi:transposase
MQYTYVGIDSHKDTHTAVFLDCFYDRAGQTVFPNMPAAFEAFLLKAESFKEEGTSLLFGLEDVSAYGRALTVFLTEKGCKVKHVNAALVAHERRNQNAREKSDFIDAECAARVLLSKLDSLPDAEPQDKYWILRTLVVRRQSVIRQNTALKNHLHMLVTSHYPSYHEFFATIDNNTALTFFKEFPSPSALSGTTEEELAAMLWKLSNGRVGIEKSKSIYKHIMEDGNTETEYQDIRDESVRSTIRQIEFNMQEVLRMEERLAGFLENFDYSLTSMKGVETVSAAQLISCIGDIKKFTSPAKLARYSGVAPITYASGKTKLQYSNERGNRELNSLFYKLAVRVSMTAGRHNRVVNPFFYDYYHRKLSEGKTKRQALKCVQRRLVNIIWNMMRHNVPYINPPTHCVPKKKPEQEQEVST